MTELTSNFYFLVQETAQKHESLFVPHSHAVLFPQEEVPGDDTASVAKELAQALTAGGYQVHTLSNTFIDRAKTHLHDGAYMWPRDCFMKSPTKGDNTVFVLPGEDSFGQKVHEIIMSEIGIPVPPDTTYIPSFLATGGYSVTSGNVLLIHEMMPDQDLGVQYLCHQGYDFHYFPTALYEGHLTNGVGKTFRKNQYVDYIEKNLMENRHNDHIDTEIGMFIPPDRQGVHFILNETYDQGFSSQVDLTIAALSRKNRIGLTVVEEQKEQYLPTNLIQCPDGSIVLPAQAQNTINSIRNFYPEIYIRPVTTCPPFRQSNGGGLRCSVNTF